MTNVDKNSKKTKMGVEKTLILLIEFITKNNMIIKNRKKCNDRRESWENILELTASVEKQM